MVVIGGDYYIYIFEECGLLQHQRHDYRSKSDTKKKGSNGN